MSNYFIPPIKQSLFTANFGSAMVLERTHGFITTPRCGNVQEISGNFVGSRCRESSRLWIIFANCWGPKGWFTVPMPLDRKTTVSPVLKDHFSDHNLQRDDDMKAAAIWLTHFEDTDFSFRMPFQKRRERERERERDSRNLWDILKISPCNSMTSVRWIV
jgi:hypothetical protein